MPEQLTEAIDLGTLTGPFVGELVFKYRIGKNGDSTVSQTVRLIEGTTTIGEWVHEDVGEMTTVPLTPERFGDMEVVFGERGVARRCFCMHWRRPDGGFGVRLGRWRGPWFGHVWLRVDPSQRSLRG